ncbi:MAG TPA: LuxR C-terminal-related transcriptional regulator [Terriglobales bacterium]|jgi:DNA-binding CsgD family transcriptional regulator|nr:LuxR C-terminal-related transcriptional regulator [Terriglobales bacterium]
MSGPTSAEPMETNFLKVLWIEACRIGGRTGSELNEENLVKFIAHGLGDGEAFPAPPGLQTPSPVPESDCPKVELEKAHCEFLKVSYPPAFDRIGKEQFDSAIKRQTLLTPRQLQVARLVASGFDNGEIAAQLDITTDGVKKHLEAVMQKSSLDRRTKIAQWFVGLPTYR